MLSPDDVLSACVGEMYRYRLAVQDQLPRLEAATFAVRSRREVIEKEERALLFGPSMSEDEFRSRLQSVRQSDVPEIWRLRTEAQFLLVAVYGIYSMAKAIRKASTGDLNRCVQRAILRFETDAPDADLLRHVHEHIDSYMRGEGKDADRLPDPTQEGAVAMLDEGLVYFIGGKLFRLREISDAAEAIARAIEECTRDI